MTRYVVYDVFTQTPFGGNPLAVIPDATALPEADLQKIAREFNFSETTFVYPPVNPGNTAKVRIFTPTMEIPFAGHPTIGTALALRDAGQDGDMILELGIGPIPCCFEGHNASFTTSVPLERLAEPDPSLVAAALGLGPDAIRTDTHPPVQVSLGLPFVLVVLRDDTDLQACAPSLDAIKRGAATYPAGLDFALFAYTRHQDQINARMFAPLDNIPEDPATGSAAATLAALLCDIEATELTLTLHQGVAMGRPSLIHAHAEPGKPIPVTITGTARRSMQGELVYGQT